MKKQTQYRITRQYEDENIIIYKREFDLKNCSGDLRYFEVDKDTDRATGKQFRSITQVRKYLKGIAKLFFNRKEFSKCQK